MHVFTLSTISLLLTITSAVPTPEPQQITILPHDVSPSSTIHDTLVAHEIIGDVLQDFEPSWYIDLQYSAKEGHSESVLLGNDIPTSFLQSRPTFTFHSTSTGDVKTASKDSIFTLILTDPDATSRDNPEKAEMCHWIMTNLTTPISDPPAFDFLLHLDVLDLVANTKPGELIEYQPPGPPPKTGPHRYVFVLLEGKKTSKLAAPAERPHWGYGPGEDGGRHGGVENWAGDNGLKVVGANFFYAQNEKQ